MLKIYIILSLFCVINCFNLLPYEPCIGNWKLLYTDNKHLYNNNNLYVQIYPIKENELSVKIKRCESSNFVTYTKIIKCLAYYNDCDDEKCMIANDFNDGEVCSLIVLKSEKYIKSIGIFEFPYFTQDYITGLNPKYMIIYKIDTQLNRLYIYFDKNKYVFQRNIDKIYKKEERVTTNVFLITNLISFYLGKLLEKFINIQ
jgi:hypothetical protein